MCVCVCGFNLGTVRGDIDNDGYQLTHWSHKIQQKTSLCPK